MVGEYGGLGLYPAERMQWLPSRCGSYLRANTSSEFIQSLQFAFEQLTKSHAFVSASIYTQITAVELECDGFLTYDRRAKFSAVEIHAIRQMNAELIGKS